MLSELSGEQKKWVEKTGFGNVLAFRMKRYAHKLGYAIVEALDRNDCSIRLQDGNIKISDVVVQMVLGLPKGEEDVDVQDRKEVLSAWESQFDRKPFSKITATMIAKEIKSYGSATNMFKLNFLVLLSNFLVESNNNGYVETDIVGFCGNIEKCSKYNWCGFVIDKLLTTHEFWAGNPSIRHFTWSLPLLTYLYLDRVSNARTQHVERTKPAYIAWTDELIKEEENYIIENNCFGKENWVQGHEGNHESHVHNLEEDERAITECVRLGEDEQGSDVQVCEKAICETVPSLLDENLEELLDDQKFMERFDSKLEALELLCKGCIADHGTALAMYPDHPKTTILKEKLAYIFETQFSVFEHTTKILETPIMSKYQCSNIHEEVLTPWSTQFVELLDEMGNSVSSEKNEQSFKIDARDEFPSFNLNLTPSQESVELEKMVESDACIAKTVVGVKQLDNMEVRRACRTKKLPATKKSPYVTRVKFIIAPALNSEGHAVWEWLFDNRKCLNQKLFKWKNTGCNKEQLQTLMSGEWVEGNVIDTWTHILNERKSRRSDSSPLRLFCTIDSTVGPLTSNYMSELDRCVIFAENMDLVLLRANMLQYREIDFDMYIFPIHKNGHHYIISYNIKYPAWEIIDNIGGCTDIEQRYGALPYMLAKKRRQLVDLCKMYCHDILGSNLNANRENLMKKAWEYMKGKRKKTLQEEKL
ncbi:hypothetical protein POM88_023208 [Heracleum sosnowskyi]|uniref:Ubiquitin-like protease family profile domain-containing protein n=1 Tax=Heracleum sosnowskyi TaxID=360622 RepID=A0AAD8MVM8_9APIA|nr:hypothetical protein POM88_023208 [Heracleum sosnowskyi]